MLWTFSYHGKLIFFVNYCSRNVCSVLCDRLVIIMVRFIILMLYACLSSVPETQQRWAWHSHRAEAVTSSSLLRSRLHITRMIHHLPKKSGIWLNISFLVKQVIIWCDSNAHHLLWGSSDINARGEYLIEYLVSSKLNILTTVTNLTLWFAIGRMLLTWN
jgi:hypothetical protein